MLAALLEVEMVADTGRYVATLNTPGQNRLIGIRALTTDHMPAGKIMILDPETCRQVFWGPAYALMDRYSDGMDIKGTSRLVVQNLCDIVALRPEQIIVGSAA